MSGIIGGMGSGLGILTTRYWVCLGGLSRKSSGYFWGRGGEAALETVGEDRQAFLRFSRAHRFLPPPIPHLFLRLQVSLPGVVGVPMKVIVVLGDLREPVQDVSGLP